MHHNWFMKKFTSSPRRMTNNHKMKTSKLKKTAAGNTGLAKRRFITSQTSLC
jgi:hypothetical protein